MADYRDIALLMDPIKTDSSEVKGDMQRYLTKLTESFFQLLTTIQRRLHNRF